MVTNQNFGKINSVETFTNCQYLISLQETCALTIVVNNQDFKNMWLKDKKNTTTLGNFKPPLDFIGYAIN